MIIWFSLKFPGCHFPLAVEKSVQVEVGQTLQQTFETVAYTNRKKGLRGFCAGSEEQTAVCLRNCRVHHHSLENASFPNIRVISRGFRLFSAQEHSARLSPHPSPYRALSVPYTSVFSL